MGVVYGLPGLLVCSSPRDVALSGKMDRGMKSLRFWTICVLLAGTAVFLHLRGSSERRIASEPLADFPIQVAAWTGIDQPIDSETLEVLGAGDFLSRIYIQ